MRPFPLLAGLLLCQALPAQQDGFVSGQVHDATGAAIPAAKVWTQSVDTSAISEAKTGSEGDYIILGLAPGEYVVQAEHPGFQRAKLKIRVESGAREKLDILLTPSETKTIVEVTGDPPHVETESGVLTTSFTEKEMQYMPLQGRNALELAILVPGVVGDPGSDEAGVFLDVPSAGAGLSVGGGRTGSAAILADGAGANSVGIGRATVTFSPDTIQEFQVITSTFSAKYGVSGGGVINTVSRAGTNQMRGSLYWYHRNPTLNARQFNRPFPNNNRRQEFGLTLGGPVRIPKVYDGRRKTFFFGSYEPRYYFDQIDIYTRFPTVEERNGDFTNMYVAPGQRRPMLYQQMRCVPSPANCANLTQINRPTATAEFPLFTAADPNPARRGLVIPAYMIDPGIKKLLETVPLPNKPFDAQGYNYFGTRGLDGTDGRWNLKVDHMVTNKNRVSGRFSDVPIFSDRYRIAKDNIFQTYPSDISNTKQVLLTDTYTVTPTIVNELRAAYTFADYSRTAPGELATNNYTRDFFGLPNATDWGYPLFQSGWGNYGLDAGSGLGNYRENQFQLSNDVTMVRGKHIFSMGGDARLLQLNMASSSLQNACCGTYAWAAAQTNSGNANTPGGTGGVQFASFLMGVPNAITIRSVIIPYYYRWKVGAAYFQDDYKLRRNLTLNMGIRWQYSSPRSEKFNRQATADLAHPTEVLDATGNLRSFTYDYLFSGFDGRSKYLEPPHKRNLEPRFGFAYSPKFGFLRGRMFVIRGGYGISHPASTGRGRNPVPDFGAGTAGSFAYTRYTTGATPPRTQSVSPQYLIGIGRNQPVLTHDPRVLQVPDGGKLCLNCAGTVDPRLPSGGLVMFEQNTKSPYTQTWNLTVQSEMPLNSVLTMSYLGTKGTHLYSPLLGINFPDRDGYAELLEEGLDPNEQIEDPFGRVDARGVPLKITRVNLLRPIPTVGDVNIAGITNSTSIYHAMTASWDRRFSRGLFFRANYTWGKSIDTSSDGSLSATNIYLWGNTRVQDAWDLRANRSVSNYDTRHKLNVAGTLQLPVGRGKKLLKQRPRMVGILVDNWTAGNIFTLTSGMPFSTYLGDANGLPGGVTGNERIRPDIVLGVPLINPRWSKRVANDVPYFNPEAFARPEFGHTGNAPRTLDWARQPWRITLNSNVLRDLYPFENRRRYFQIRAEAFNAMNHVNFMSTANETFSLFASGVPATRTGVPLQGPIPYLWGVGSANFKAGTREAILAQYYNQNFGKLWRDRNSAGRIFQFALRLYF
ncbi:MAG: carboxypeptidase regulatory-like domain-containing protein [Acidobacteria bacterium]|nr:carboxypeptidase regulatory-like domain-containing protein [Acidobacteriota bacterium]